MITIYLNKKEANALVLIANRYYFDLFKQIRVTKEEEFLFRDVLLDVAKQIENYYQEKNDE